MKGEVLMMITKEMIISGFISKIVSDVVDIPENAIRNADKKRRDKNQSIETRIYQVTVDAIKEFTKREYKGQDVLYDAAESIIRGFIRNRNDKVEAVRMGLKMLVSQVGFDTCEDFLEVMCYEICKDENRDLAIEVVLLQLDQMNGYVQEGFRRSYLNDEEINKKLDYLIKELSNKKVYEERYSREIYVKNRAKEYADKWNENVFLNDYKKRDEKAGVNIKLRELYLERHLPHYIWKDNTKLSYDLKELLKEYTVDNDDKKMLLILGRAGVGKSTLITWIMANLIEKRNEVLLYLIASDLKNVNWEGDDILNEILKTLKLGYDELEGKILILDGFDEIHTGGDGERILNQIYHKLKRMNYLKQFSLVITCRENYIHKLRKIECDHISLQKWDDKQIKSFCEIYGSVGKREVSQDTLDKMLENKEVFGIPLILYMVLALNISIDENGSIVDVYDRIFSLNGGGIYDRCINNLSYGEEHRISKIKQQIYQISQRIAFWIFENNSEEAFIPQAEYEGICDIVIKETEEKNEDIKGDVFIGSYFEPIRHCEGVGTDELQFVHRSIYEYFVAVYFYESIHMLSTKEKIAAQLGMLLKDGCLSVQILKFIEYKLKTIRMYNFSDTIKEVFQIMLRDGMTYYIGMPLLNIIIREMNIFSNMLKVAYLGNSALGKLDNNIVFYLQYNKQVNLNLKGIELRSQSLNNVYLKRAYLEGAHLEGAHLERAYLEGAYLGRAHLEGAYLGEAYLVRADLGGAHLEGAYLVKANLVGTYLEKANLKETIFDERQVDLLYKKYNLNGSKVYLFDTRDIIDYKEYCIRKQK